MPDVVFVAVTGTAQENTAPQADGPIKIEDDAPAAAAPAQVKSEVGVAATAPIKTTIHLPLSDLLLEYDDEVDDDFWRDMIKPVSEEQVGLMERLGIKPERIARVHTMKQASRLISKALDFKKRGAAALSKKWQGVGKGGGAGAGGAGAATA